MDGNLVVQSWDKKVKERKKLIFPGLCREPRTGLALLTKAQGTLSRRSWKPGQENELSGFPSSRESAGGRERERERERKTRGPKPLVEEGCFNDLSVSIYRLLYKEFLSTMIKIRKPYVQQLLSRKQGISNGHKVRRQSISQERGSWLSSFVVTRMFTEGNIHVCFISWPQTWEQCAPPLVPVIRNW